jgi:hypothetical protein
MRLEEIDLGKDDPDRLRDAIIDHRNQQVILKDEHEGLGQGIIGRIYDDCYDFHFADLRGERQLHYHDLKQLLVIKNDPRYPTPEI